MLEHEDGQVGTEATAQHRLTPLGSYDGSLADRVCLSLRDAILELEYKPGEILRKSEICALLGVSRSPVSEAVTRLAAEGLVRIVPQAGTFVARFSMAEIREGAFLREALELAAVEALAPVITGDQIQMLRRNLRIQEALIGDGDAAGFYQMDAAMHEMIMDFTGFPKLAQFARTAWVQVNRTRRLVLPEPGRIGETLVEHSRIVSALEARDPQGARDATRAHLRKLLAFLEPLERDRPELFEAG